LHLDFYKEDPSAPNWATWIKTQRLKRTEPNRGIRFQRIKPALEAVRANAGLTICGLALLGPYIDDGTLSLPFPVSTGQWTDHAFQARFRPDALLRPQVKRFREWLAESGYSHSRLALAATGIDNAASGYQALYKNTTGTFNTASGSGALYTNSTADYNTASGYEALYSSNGGSNTATGYQALYANTSGGDNTATGLHALANNISGSSNVALGWHAGYNLTTGSNNIDISNVGVIAESGAIRIGTTGTQSKAFIAGIYGISVSGSAVVVNSSGQLGVVVSSERFKTDIAPIGPDSAKLQALRPVKFHLKTDPNGAVQYGLIAEEVAKVYPELVIRDENGRIDGVRYDELAPMLLNEMQEQQKVVAARAAIQDAKIAQLQEQLSGIQAALVKLQSPDQLVAQR
jgi:hypothetical protein